MAQAHVAASQTSQGGPPQPLEHERGQREGPPHDPREQQHVLQQPRQQPPPQHHQLEQQHSPAPDEGGAAPALPPPTGHPRPRKYGDPSIWGEESPPVPSAQALRHAPDIRIVQLTFGPTTLDTAWRGDVVDIHREVFPVRYRSDFYKDLLRWNFRTIAAIDYSDALPRPMVVGVATGRMEVKSYLRWCEAVLPARVLTTNRAWIMTLATRPAYRGHAIASQVLSALVAALGCTSVLLHCTDTNSRALSLYKRHDFAVVERIPRHYHFNGDWHNALLLRKTTGRGATAAIPAPAAVGKSKPWSWWGNGGARQQRPQEAGCHDVEGGGGGALRGACAEGPPGGAADAPGLVVHLASPEAQSDPPPPTRALR